MNSQQESKEFGRKFTRTGSRTRQVPG